MENPELAKSYKVLNIWTGEVSIRTKKAVEPETCGCGEPLFTLADGKSKGCPSCGEQY